MAPSPADEVQLLQAGLGKRNLTMPGDLTHSEVMYIYTPFYAFLSYQQLKTFVRFMF